MAPPIATASLTLAYPIYASDFDPQNSDFLVVGGGGGEGRSGVGNKITLLDASKKHELAEVVDIDLSRDEDSVTSLAVASSGGDAATVYAGINSSEKEALQGRNEHLRSFRVAYPAKRRKTAGEKDGAVSARADVKIEAVGKAALFEATKGRAAETYQRVLRLSPVGYGGGGLRLGAIATGLAPKGEVVIFDASRDAPGKADVLKRIQVGEGEEAADVDLVEADEGFLVAYCTDYEVYVCQADPKGKDKTRFLEPRLLHNTPHPDVFATNKRPKFRSLRFLTPRLLVVVLNLPDRSGVEVLLLSVPEQRPLEGLILLRKRLHKSAKSATCLAAATLPASTATQNQQHVVAVAGSDISLTILTLENGPTSQRTLSFGTYSLLKNVHPLQMTSLAFSTFVPPAESSTASAGPQYLKLASSGMSSTVTVHTLPLIPYPPLSKKEPVRYTLQSPASRNELAQMSLSVLFAVIMVALGAFLLQAFTEIRGGTPEYLGAKGWLSQSLHDRIARPYMFADAPVIVSSMPTAEGVRAERSATVLSSGYEAVKSALPDVEDVVAPLPLPLPFKEALLQRNGADADSLRKAVVVRDGEQGLSTELHEHEAAALKEKARKWEDLEQHEKSTWLKKLEAAGEWTIEQGETVLKGVFFSELAGTVADAIGG